MSDTQSSNQQALPLLQLLRGLWRHISSRRRVQLAFVALLMLASAVLEIFSLGMIIPFLGVLTSPDIVFGHPLMRDVIRIFGLTSSSQLILPLAAMFAGAAVLSGFSRLVLLWAQTRIGNSIGADLGAEAYRRTLYQPYIVHAMRNSSEIVAALMNKIHTVVYSIVVPLLTLLTSAVMMVAIVLFMLLVNPELTAIAFAGFGIIYLLVVYTTRRRLVRDSHRVNEGQTEVTQVVQEGLGGIRDVLIDGLQDAFVRIYQQADWRLRRALVSIHVISGAPRPVIEAFGLVLISAIACVLASRQEGLSTVLPMLGALAMAGQRLLPLVQQSYSGWTYITGGTHSLRDVIELLDQPMPVEGADAHSPLAFNKQIELRDVRFQFAPGGPWVLNGINLSIPRGSRTGFIGATGSGKSTLLDVIIGLLSPTSGTILIDGIALDDRNRRAWQDHIAHVPQTIFLKDATIAENIAFGARPEEIDHARVQEAARRAQIDDTIKSWDLGYDTPVGERGMRLSGGQRQRIGIARAFYKRADVIVFDEATSALDGETEQSVMESIYASEKDLTVLMVAHRLSTLKHCDRILDLNNAQIERAGTYQQLVGEPLQVPQHVRGLR